MTLTIITVLLVIDIAWVVYEIVEAPTVKDDPIKHESDKWHDECVKSRQKKK